MTENYLVWVFSFSGLLNLIQLWFVRRANRKLAVAEGQCRQLQGQLQNANPPAPNNPPGSHPAWALFHILVLIAGLWGILWVTAAKFDATEIKAILGYLVVVIGASQVAPESLRLIKRT